jgi:hypothetical protein
MRDRDHRDLFSAPLAPSPTLGEEPACALACRTGERHFESPEATDAHMAVDRHRTATPFNPAGQTRESSRALSLVPI